MLNMAVFGAVIAYIMQMVSFLVLRRRYPEIPRPYRSPLGEAGAVIAGLLALLCLIMLFLNPDYVLGVYGCAIWFGAGLLYFALHGRKHLVYSPEEAFAAEHYKPVKNSQT